MRKSRVLSLAVAGVIGGGAKIAIAQTGTELFTTEADWAGSWAINSTPTTGTQSGWAGWGTNANTYVPATVDGGAPTGQGTSNSTSFNNPTETLSFNGPDLDGSTLNGLGNYDNNNDGTEAAPDDTVGVPGPGLGNYTGTSFVGYSNVPSSPYLPSGTLSAAQSTSPGGSLTVNNYAGGYDTITTGNMLQGGTTGGNTNFLNALYQAHGSGILKIDFTSPLGGTTLSTAPSGAEGSPYFLIGFLVYSNNAAYASGWVSPVPLPVGTGIQPFDPYEFGSYTVNHGTYWTGYLPYSGLLPPSSYTNAEFGIIINSGDSQTNINNVYAGTLTIDDIEVLSVPQGTTYTWAPTGGGSWASAANWTSIAAVANSQGGIAVFNQTTAAATVTMDIVPGSRNWTVGNIDLNNPSGYTFNSRSGQTASANGGLIINNGSLPAQIDDNAGTHTFNIPIQLNSLVNDLNVVNSGDGLVFNNTISGTGGLQIIGSGTVTLSGSNTYSGGTNINGGNLIVTSAGGLPSATNLGIGNFNIPSSLKFMPSLGTIPVGNLVLDDPANLTIDISNDAFLVNYAVNGFGSPLDRVESALAVGGIISGILPAGYGIGYADNGSSLLIERTLIGDTNLDGTVNLTDLLTLLNNFGQTGAVWSQGDFNYDQTVNLTDLLGLLNNYGQTASSSAFRSAQVVPEPMVAGLIALLGIGFLGRRRV